MESVLNIKNRELLTDHFGLLKINGDQEPVIYAKETIQAPKDTCKLIQTKNGLNGLSGLTAVTCSTQAENAEDSDLKAGKNGVAKSSIGTRIRSKISRSSIRIQTEVLIENEPAIVGVTATMTVKFSCTDPDFDLNRIESSIQDKKSKVYQPTQNWIDNQTVKLNFCPSVSGGHVIKFQHPGSERYRRVTIASSAFVVDSNAPSLRLDDHAGRWPTRVEVVASNPKLGPAFGTTDSHLVFVQYLHSVSLFTDRGVFLKEVQSEDIITDFSVSPDAETIALAINGHTLDKGDQIRFQEVQIFSTITAQRTDRFGWEPPIFEIPTVLLAFVTNQIFLFLNRDRICFYSLDLKDMIREMDFEYSTLPSTLVFNHGHIYIADSIHQTVKTYTVDTGLLVTDNFECDAGDDDADLDAIDKEDQKGYELIKEKITFKLQCIDSEHAAICGLAADSKGNVLVSEATSHSVQLYNDAGKLVWTLSTDRLMWPMGVGIWRNCFYLADHGHGVVKKYRYK